MNRQTGEPETSCLSFTFWMGRLTANDWLRYGKAQSSNRHEEQANTNISITTNFDEFFVQKLASRSWIGHPGKPKNASKLELGLNFTNDPISLVHHTV